MLGYGLGLSNTTALLGQHFYFHAKRGRKELAKWSTFLYISVLIWLLHSVFSNSSSKGSFVAALAQCNSLTISSSIPKF